MGLGLITCGEEEVVRGVRQALFGGLPDRRCASCRFAYHAFGCSSELVHRKLRSSHCGVDGVQRAHGLPLPLVIRRILAGVFRPKSGKSFMSTFKDFRSAGAMSGKHNAKCGAIPMLEAALFIDYRRQSQGRLSLAKRPVCTISVVCRKPPVGQTSSVSGSKIKDRNLDKGFGDSHTALRIAISLRNGSPPDTAAPICFQPFQFAQKCSRTSSAPTEKSNPQST